MKPPTTPDLSLVRLPDALLHVACAGPAGGPLTILLHGFPEFWFGWRHQIDALAAAGLRVLAPDQRGYNLSSKPRDLAAYHLDRVADDVLALADL
ncbi:Epoxide hydrolase A [Methylobacterium isbiliense]|uniref:Epoxide hydrolase A n=1 Tax=Methylobacterium isbiliense TaxID=315478 RepID=A0ABQ4S8R3_9HYPH|nr:Epoxide hydrolase A [Methylobacterium isbiliense]